MLPIVLASSSPYRKELLEKLHLDFSTCSPSIDETPLAGEKPTDLVLRLAQAKAQAVEQLLGQPSLEQAANKTAMLIIASDQVAVLGEQILGKPHTVENAVAQLLSMQGKKVEFLTSLALLNSQSGNLQIELVRYSVHFRILSEAQIRRYVEKEQPLNCAGSFKSEGYGITLFEKFEGEDPNTLIGLPLIRLVRMLEAEGLMLP